MKFYIKKSYYLFKQDTLRNKVIDAKEIEQWKYILN